MQLANPLVPPQALMSILIHVNEHIQMMVSQSIAQAARMMAAQAGVTVSPLDEDKLLVDATKQANIAMAQQLGGLLEQIGALQQQIQQRMPQPPMDPAVQASIKIAEMDTQRKTQYDQGMLQMKQAEMQATQQKGMAEMQMEQARMQFEQQMEAGRAQLEAASQQFEQQTAQLRVQADMQVQSLKQEIEMMKNEADNHQRQTTELLKNRDDNQTKLLIEQMKAELNTIVQPSQPSQPMPDLTPQLQQLTQVLDQMGRQKTDDALTEVMMGLRATIASLNKPKMLIRDAQGKAQGIQ